MRRLQLIHGGGQPSLSNPTGGEAEATWAAILRLRGQLDGLKSNWTPDTHVVEKTFYVIWSRQLDEMTENFLSDHPHLRPKP